MALASCFVQKPTHIVQRQSKCDCSWRLSPPASSQSHLSQASQLLPVWICVNVCPLYSACWCFMGVALISTCGPAGAGEARTSGLGLSLSCGPAEVLPTQLEFRAHTAAGRATLMLRLSETKSWEGSHLLVSVWESEDRKGCALLTAQTGTWGCPRAAE